MSETKRSVVAPVPMDSNEDQERVNAAVRAGIEPPGGIRKFVSPASPLLYFNLSKESGSREPVQVPSDRTASAVRSFAGKGGSL